MSDYTKSTNFASKDSLSTGNPLKIVKGTEIDTEFNNIATAIATKADLNSPSLTTPTMSSPTITGTPVAPTATAGTNTTQLATTAFVKTAIDNYDAALTVSTSQIETSAVTTTNIADSAVTTAKVADSGVTTAKIADSNVTTAKIADSNVTTAKIADSNVTTAKINNAAVTAAKLSGAQSGSAPIYAARAWVVFNGTGTVSISASGNVSSITDNGTGDYTVNFTTAMSDATYSAVAQCNGYASNNTNQYVSIKHDGAAPGSGSSYKSTTSVSVISGDGGTLRDGIDYNIAVFPLKRKI